MSRFLFRHLVVALVLLLCSALAQAQAGYTQTRHPIVLVHGLFGFDRALGVYDYWYGIGDELRAGGATVYTASVSAANATELRGEQLIRDLDTLRAVTGRQKFNLVGHSHGGPTVRYVASVRPDLVASVTLIGSPNTGAPLADALSTTLPPGSPLREPVARFVDLFAGFLGRISGNRDPQDALAAMASLSTAGATAFNRRHPQGQPPRQRERHPLLLDERHLGAHQRLRPERPGAGGRQPAVRLRGQRRPGGPLQFAMGPGAARRLRLEPR